MNILPSLCNGCGNAILVSQNAWSDPFAHICTTCQSIIFNGLPDTELSDDLEEFLDDELIDNEFEWLDPEDIEPESWTGPPKCDCGAKVANTHHARWCSLLTKKEKKKD